MLIEIYFCVWKQYSITILENSFMKSCLANRGPEVFPNWVLLDSRCTLVVWTTWPLKCYWGCGVLFDAFSLPLIAHAFRTGMHHCASVIDRPQNFPTAAVLGNMFALRWSAQSFLSASEKLVTPNAIVKRFSQTLFLLSENTQSYMYMPILGWIIIGITKEV